MSAEPEIIVQSREELIALLTEAAEIEHGLMCCYLFAAFSLKAGDDSGLSPAQLAATRRWRAAVLDVAIEEMLHLGLVANMMAAIGAVPHFARPNFPVAAGYHPAGVVVELAPFSKETMDHFVFLERPEGMDMSDGAGFSTGQAYARAMRPDALMPSAQDFLTVGHLYRAIEKGFTGLVHQLGEAALFIGQSSAQVGPAVGRFRELVAVKDLASACAAIAAIVEQGEGTPGHAENSHYNRFCAVRDELAAMTAADPEFSPVWPVARNPVMRKPVVTEGRVHVAEPVAARLLDLANAAYGLMLRCLMGVFGQPDATDAERRRLYDAAIDLMHVVLPLAQRLAQMPVQEGVLYPTAGMTFTLHRSIMPVADTAIAFRIVAERAGELARASASVVAGFADLAGIPAMMARISAALAAGIAQPLSDEGTASTPAAPTETPRGNGVEEAVGRDITLRFEAKRCIHARFCVTQAPTVFKANMPGEWIFPDTMDADHLVAVAENCPSGAITYQRYDGRMGESPAPVNLATLRENGPYAMRAEISLAGHGLMTRATLCRCGASNNKPFCDGSHKDAGFAATGEPDTRPSDALAVRKGPLLIEPLRNGPLSVTGPLEICAGSGRTVDRVTGAWLCRCGGSASKPFCDGTHARVGFTAD